MHLHNQSMFLQCYHTLYTPSFWMPSMIYPAVQPIRTNQSPCDYCIQSRFCWCFCWHLCRSSSSLITLTCFRMPTLLLNCATTFAFLYIRRITRWTKCEDADMSRTESISTTKIMDLISLAISFPVGAAASKLSSLLFLFSHDTACRLAKCWSIKSNWV